MSDKKAVAIVVGGGPAPGINGVISAVTIEAINRGHTVYGIRNGFSQISLGNESCVEEMDIEDVSWIHNSGGSVLGTARTNPTKNPEHVRNILQVLKNRGVGYLVSIGGDDTAHSARVIGEMAGGEISVAHVPKTIDNDLPLPGMASTFGYESARSEGTHIIETLMVDAKTTSRWYLAIAMGRKAGHLALGIGISAGATLTIIPEEFPEGNVKMDEFVDIIAATALKRYAFGKRYGVMVLAEGLVEKLDPSSLPNLDSIERDPHGHVLYRDLDFGRIIKNAVRQRLLELGVDLPVVDKNVGYELRCHAPIPFDREYTRQLGFGAIAFLLTGGSNAMITRQGNEMVPVPFAEIVDPETNKTKVRYVDTNSTVYNVAQKYMIRLRREDLESDFVMDKLAAVSGKFSNSELRRAFGRLSYNSAQGIYERKV